MERTNRTLLHRFTAGTTGGRRPETLAVTVELTRESWGEELHVTGESYDRAGRYVSGGQTLEVLDQVIRDGKPAEALTVADLEELARIWRAWHLNGARAGCEHQRAAGWDTRPIDATKPLRAYGRHFPGQKQDSWNMLTWVRREEHPEGLLCEPCPTCGYRYGMAWLHEPLPAAIRAWLVELKARTPAGDSASWPPRACSG